jgi:hypothetical protein
MQSLKLNEDELELIDPDEGPSEAEVALLRQPETKNMIMNLFVHQADVSNPCKNWKICEFWSEVEVFLFLLRSGVTKSHFNTLKG